MKITLSTTPLSSGSKTRGIGVYTRELLSALRRYFPNDTFRTTATNPYALASHVVHYPYFDLFYPTLPMRLPLPTVVTIHDVIPLKYPTHFPVGIRGKLALAYQRWALRGVSAILTDSASSKADIIKYLHLPPERIHVIPLAPLSNRPTAKLTAKVKETYHLPPEYMLYVGDINWNKNLPGLLTAFAQLKNTNLHLLCVGKVFDDQPDIPEYHAITATIKQYALESRVHLIGYVPSHHLPLLYRLATLYVQPSWDEGFGFPVLEAMKFGAPVVSSNRGSLPEVGGDAVIYFDPAKIQEWSQILDRVSRDGALRADLRARGEQRAKDFSWKAVATATRNIYAAVK